MPEKAQTQSPQTNPPQSERPRIHKQRTEGPTDGPVAEDGQARATATTHTDTDTDTDTNTEAPSPEPRDASRDPLFGSGLSFSTGWSRHDDAITTGFLTAARRLPKLMALCMSWCWRADRRAVVVIILCELWVGAANAFGLLAANQVLAHVFAGPSAAHLRAAAPQILLVAALTAAGAGAQIASTAAAARLKPVVERLAYTQLLERSSRVELLMFSSPGFKDLLDSAQYGAGWLGMALDQMISVLTSVMALVAAASVLSVLHPALALLLPVIVLPRGWASARSVRRRNASRLAWLPLMRQQRELTYLLTGQSAAEEIRVHDAGTFLVGHYQRLARANEAEQARLARRDARDSALSGTLSGAATAFTYVLLGYLLATGRIPLAAGATALLAVRMGTGQLTTLLQAVNSTFEYGLYVADLAEAIELAEAHAIPAEGVPVPGPPALIEARGVRFTYPNAAKPALDGVDVTIRRGEIVALVGENGSGKTTLARLLTGLYLPDAGAVAWDGADTRELARTEVYEQVAVLAQGFQHWPFTLGANVAIGRHRRGAAEPALDGAAEQAGAERMVASFADRWATLLAPEYKGGVDMSGGQWQLTGLTRAHFRDAPILVLDEPTAALDPRIEAETFDRVRALAGGRTVLLITHRLYSVREADRIIVLNQGRVVETGTHEELMAHTGIGTGGEGGGKAGGEREGGSEGRSEGEYRSLYLLQASQFGLAMTTPAESGEPASAG